MATINNVVNKNVGAGMSVKELGVLAISKVVTERISTKVLKENGTFKSGTIKIAVGVVVGFTIKNKYVRYAAAGVVLDGAEDISDNLATIAESKAQKAMPSVRIQNSTGSLSPVY